MITRKRGKDGGNNETIEKGKRKQIPQQYHTPIIPASTQ
jgi:hypothetical protein